MLSKLNKLFFPKQQKLLSRLKHDKFKRINILVGAVRSGKTYISLIIWGLWVAIQPKDRLFLMCGKSLTTLKRNCLLPLQKIFGKKNFRYSIGQKEGRLFGRQILFEGANDARSEDKIRGLTLGGAYCDELTLFPEDFFSMLLSRLSEKGAKLFATTNPDRPTHWLKVKYIDRAAELNLLTINFTIDENTFLDPEFVAEQKKEHVGVFFERFIRGLWVAAEGAIYQIFSNNRKKYYIELDKLPPLEVIYIGVDFGGNKSAHTFVATGIGMNGNLYALKSVRHKATGVTPDQLYKLFKEFATEITIKHGKVEAVYGDSEGQTLLNGMRSIISDMDIPVWNSLKKPIIDRIHATTLLMSIGRFFVVRGECETLEKALCDAVYDNKSLKDTRLDNGKSDIDTLDAFEYSFEAQIYRLTEID